MGLPELHQAREGAGAGMSKAVRIRDHLHAEIERLAQQNRRSIIGQLELLLEQALRLPGNELSERDAGAPGVGRGETVASQAEPPSRSRSESSSDVKTDFK